MNKILISVAGFFPAEKYGGPTVSIKNFCDLLHDSTEAYIVTSNHEMGSTETLKGITAGWNDYKNCRVQYLSENEMCEAHFNKIVEEIKPTHIYINSLFDYRFAIPLVHIASKKGIPLILAPRGELCKNAFNGKFKKLPYIWILNHYLKKDNFFFQSTADDEMLQIKRYIKDDDSHIFKLPNIPSITTIKPHGKVNSNCLYCVFLARLQRKKNLLGALNILSRVTIPVRFDIYGPREASNYWEKCKKAISQLPSNIQVEYKGAIPHTEVVATLENYDLYFFPTFSENYGHSIIESLQAGTPVLISDQTPWKDLERFDAGWALNLSDEESFINVIEKMYNISQEEYTNMSKCAQEYVVSKLRIDDIKKQYECMLSFCKS